MRALQKWGIGLGVLLLVCLLLTFFIDRTDHVAFNKEKWQDTKLTTTEPYIRTQMVDTIVDDLLKPGMSKDSVIELLGPPTNTDYFSSYDLHYWLGPEPGSVSVDSSWLVIKLQDGAVTHYGVLTD